MARKKESEEIRYIHVDEYLRTKELSEDIKFGFKVFLKVQGGSYQLSLEDFDKELERFYNRKI
ncbi:hypothetical protein [Bacillus phage YungSlug]|nr:hypothetical protein [Bacillus phage YungSlug]